MLIFINVKALIIFLIAISCLFRLSMFADIFFHIYNFVFYDNKSYFLSFLLYLRKF